MTLLLAVVFCVYPSESLKTSFSRPGMKTKDATVPRCPAGHPRPLIYAIVAPSLCGTLYLGVYLIKGVVHLLISHLGSGNNEEMKIQCCGLFVWFSIGLQSHLLVGLNQGICKMTPAWGTE